MKNAASQSNRDRSARNFWTASMDRWLTLAKRNRHDSFLRGHALAQYFTIKRDLLRGDSK